MKGSAFHRVKMHDCFAELCTPVFRDNGFLQSLAATLEWAAMDTPYFHQGGRYIVKGTKDDLMPLSDPPQTKLEALLDRRPCFDKLRQGFLGSNLSDVERSIENMIRKQYPYLAGERVI